MPYNHRRSRYSKRPKATAAKRVASAAKRRTGAKAQGRQITSLARSLAHVQHTLKADQTTKINWQFSIQNQQLYNANIANYEPVVIPLSSGPCGRTINGAASSLQGPTIPPAGPDCAWLPQQPYGTDPGVETLDTSQDNGVGVPWCRLYKQHVRVCFNQSNMNRVCRFKMFVVRLARPEDGSTLDSSKLQVLEDIDGSDALGRPNQSLAFTSGESFYSCPGWIGPNAAGPTAGQTDSLGYQLVRMNSNRFKVVHQREFVLGRVVNPTGVANAVSLSETQGAAATPEARDYYETSFTVDYGGRKVAPSDQDTVASKQQPMTMEDLSYRYLAPEMKHWIVIFPSRQLSPAANNEGMGAPAVSLISNVSTRVPI